MEAVLPGPAVAVLDTTTLVRRPAEVTSWSARYVEGTAPENNPQPSLPPQSGERITAKPRGESSSKAQLVLSSADGDAVPAVNKPLSNPNAGGQSSRPKCAKQINTSKTKVQTSSRGAGKTTGEKPRPRPNPICPRSGVGIPTIRRHGAVTWA